MPDDKPIRVYMYQGDEGRAILRRCFPEDTPDKLKIQDYVALPETKVLVAVCDVCRYAEPGTAGGMPCIICGVGIMKIVEEAKSADR